MYLAVHSSIDSSPFQHIFRVNILNNVSFVGYYEVKNAV